MPHPDDRERRAWGWAIGLQLIVDILEGVMAPHTRSHALWSDFLHNANDVVLMAISAWPVYSVMLLHHRGYADRKSRWRHLASKINIAALMISGAGACLLGVQRLLGHPVDVNYAAAWPIAAISAVANMIIYLAIRPFGGHSHIRVLGWHQLWDVFSALSTVAILMLGTSTSGAQLDATASILIGLGMMLHWPAHRFFGRQGRPCTHHHGA